MIETSNWLSVFSVTSLKSPLCGVTGSFRQTGNMTQDTIDHTPQSFVIEVQPPIIPTNIENTISQLIVCVSPFDVAQSGSRSCQNQFDATFITGIRTRLTGQPVAVADM